jgi:hypothetical protein
MTTRPWWLLPPGRLNPWWWIPFGAGLLWLDFLTGPSATFPVLYVLPVCLAAWYSGRWPALALAVAVPLARLAALVERTPSQDLPTLAFATLLRGVVIVFLALWFARLSDLERDLDRQVKVLEGMLPICSFCKSIRGQGGDWEPLEDYISRWSEAEFSHGVCPSCLTKHYPTFSDPDAVQKADA